MAVHALGGPWGPWSCRGQALVGQLGSQSLSANQVSEAQPGVLAASPEAGSITCISFLREPSPVGDPQVHNSLICLSTLLPASHADHSGAALVTHSKVKRPQAVHPMKKDQYITVLFLQKLKMSSRICIGCELGTGDHLCQQPGTGSPSGPTGHGWSRPGGPGSPFWPFTPFRPGIPRSPFSPRSLRSPFSPLGPGKPSSPGSPGLPFSPLVPGSPIRPSGPAGPGRPLGPLSPDLPFSPFAPSKPLGPWTP